jgi:hypothetical protein
MRQGCPAVERLNAGSERLGEAHGLGTVRACSGVLELAGASLALWMLAWMLRSEPPGRTRTGLWPVLPFVASAFIALCVGLRSHTSLQVRARCERLKRCHRAPLLDESASLAL